MKVLIIGLGSIAQRHIDSLMGVDATTEIFALRSSTESEKYSNVTDIASLNEIEFTPDFIIISNPTHLHYASIKEVIQFGCPLFIEKPSVTSMNEANEILTLMENKNLITYVACNLRFHPCLQFVKEHLSSGIQPHYVNEVNVYCGSYLPDWRPGKDFRNLYSTKTEQGGGVHFDLIHELDYLYWIFGKPLGQSKTLKSMSTLQISSFDYANYMLDFGKFSANVILNYYRRKPKRTFEILFDNETWEIDLLKNTIFADTDTLMFHSDLQMIDTYKMQMQYFIDCIQNERQTMNQFRDSVEVLKICLHEQS